ncbi:NUDIX domain-containing protein, partial [Saccharopolyspora cebuensis]|uniref:NUDIX domain-containing protein n=1 Tax=Saccharopolyspora cebuensis TaxID=418759 RepID=UPI0031E610D7
VDAAVRELAEETGLAVREDDLHRIEVYDEPGRDPRGRYVSTAYLVELPTRPEPRAGDDAARAEWVAIDDLTTSWEPMAFDHARILIDVLQVLTAPPLTGQQQ